MHHQTSLFPLLDYEPDFTSDDWETPDNVAQAKAALTLPSDRHICEPAAGTGQVAKYLPPGSFCCEIKPGRVAIGKQKAPHCQWVQANFLALALEMPPFGSCDGLGQGFHLLISNPPFSLAIEFIEQGLRLLNWSYPHARMLYLLPIDFCCSIGRGTAFQKLDCYIHHEYRIIDRVAYIRNGKVCKGRQVYDVVFDIRPSRKASAVSFWKFC